MSLKPEVIPQDQVIEQVQQMTQQKQQLEHHLVLLQSKLKMIESSLSENDQLKKKVEELMEQSLSHFQNEWKRRTEFFPDIRLKAIEKALALLR